MELSPELREKLREAKKVLKQYSKNQLIMHSLNLSLELNRLKAVLADMSKGEKKEGE